MSEPSQDQILALAARALEDKPSEIPSADIHALVAQYAVRRETFLDTVRQHGSPLYVLETQVLRERAARLSVAFNQAFPVPVRVYYAVKSNNHPLVAQTFLECGLGLDVSSGRELQGAVELGAGDILFSGPGKTEAELAQAVDQADRVTVLLDSFAELQRLESQARQKNTLVTAGVRLTTQPHGLWRKFGIALHQLNDFLAAAESCRHVRLSGLQFHTSWNLTPTAQTDFIKTLGCALRELPAARISRLRFLDMGGGYWPHQGEWLQAAGTPAGALQKLLTPASLDTRRRYVLPGTPIESFAQTLSRAVREHLLDLADFTIYLEPGRWLCNDGMHLLMTVVDQKAPDLVITDAGTNAIGWERFETDYIPVINLTRPALTEIVCDIHGCLCTPHDIWGYSCWGKDIRAGDILLVPLQGAYTYSLRQDFIKPLPQTAVL